jgi:hypothetical protein
MGPRALQGETPLAQERPARAQLLQAVRLPFKILISQARVLTVS